MKYYNIHIQESKHGLIYVSFYCQVSPFLKLLGVTMLVFYKTDRVSANPLSGMSFTARRQPRSEMDIPDRGFADTLSVL